jgi:hypothetical protein
MSTIEELTLRWARRELKNFNRWELNELHNEAFLVAVKLISKGRYDPSKASLNTYLWHALPQDVRHRYRRQNGERILTNAEGKKKYTKRERIDNNPGEREVSKEEICLTIIEPKCINEWLYAKSKGITDTVLQSVNDSITVEQQLRKVEKAYANKQQTKRGKR